MELTAAHEDAKNRLAQAEDELIALNGQIDALRLEVKGLEYAVARHHGRRVTAGAVLGSEEWADMPRTRAITRMMARIAEPVSPKVLAERLQKVGRKADSRDYVAAALNYLQKKGKVRNESYGKWVLLSEGARNPQGEMYPGETAAIQSRRLGG